MFKIEWKVSLLTTVEIVLLLYYNYTTLHKTVIVLDFKKKISLI